MGDETTVALNRRARHDFTIDETFEAGIVLTGTEIKSLRAGKANLSDAYARIERGEAWLVGAHIAPVRGWQSLQPRAEADAQAAPPSLGDRRAAGQDQGQGPDDRAAAPLHQRARPRQGRARAGARQAAPRPPPRHRRSRRPARRRPRAGRRPARTLSHDDRDPGQAQHRAGRPRRSTPTPRVSRAGSSSAAWRASRAARCSRR